MDEASLWEYRVRSFGTGLRAPKNEEIEAELNDWGEEGWEVVAIRSHEGSSKMTVVAKRPLTPAARRQRTMPQGSW